jgi:hypothetical protein
LRSNHLYSGIETLLSRNIDWHIEPDQAALLR